MTVPYNARKAAWQLDEWAQDHQVSLPYSAQQIAAFEAAGYIVELDTGFVFADPDAPADTLAARRRNTPQREGL